MMRACLPLSRKNSPIAQPEYGARYCRGAASEAVELTTMVYFMASTCRGGGGGKNSVSVCSQGTESRLPDLCR